MSPRRRQVGEDSFRIRRATLRNVEDLVHQRRGMWWDMGIRDPTRLDDADRAYRRWVKPEIREGRYLGWIVETSDRMVIGGGCLWLRPTQPRPHKGAFVDPYLLSMFVEPRFRRKGVASLIIKHAVEWCRRNGYTRILLHANKKGRHLYRKLGFIRTWEMRLEVDEKSRPITRAPNTQRKRRKR